MSKLKKNSNLTLEQLVGNNAKKVSKLISIIEKNNKHLEEVSNWSEDAQSLRFCNSELEGREFEVDEKLFNTY